MGAFPVLVVSLAPLPSDSLSQSRNMAPFRALAKLPKLVPTRLLSRSRRHFSNQHAQGVGPTIYSRQSAPLERDTRGWAPHSPTQVEHPTHQRRLGIPLINAKKSFENPSLAVIVGRTLLEVLHQLDPVVGVHVQHLRVMMHGRQSLPQRGRESRNKTWSTPGDNNT